MSGDMENIQHPTSNVEESALLRTAATGEGTARADTRPTGDEITNGTTGRLSVQTVERLHRVLSGDVRTERMVEDYIKFRWKARNLFYIPPDAAREIVRRPADFLRAAKNYCEPELGL